MTTAILTTDAPANTSMSIRYFPPAILSTDTSSCLQ